MVNKIFNLTEIWALLALFALEIVLIKKSQISFDSYSGVLLAVIGLLVISLIYGKNGRSLKLSQMAYFGAITIASGIAGLILSYLAAAASHKLFDEEYAALDAALGLNFLEWFVFLETQPLLNYILKLAYSSLLLQLAFSVVYFSHTLQTNRNKELFWIVLLSATVTSALSAIFPALGPHYHFNFLMDKAIHIPDVLLLRSLAAETFSVTELEGIIVLPSFHTVLAIVFSYVHRGRQVIFPAILTLNLLMLISTPTHGGHYFADIIAGAGVAIGSIAFVRHINAKNNVTPAVVSSQRKKEFACLDKA